MNIITRSIPNTITCLNLLSGCLAIVAAFRPDTPLVWGYQGWQVSCAMIFAAAVFDFCDGLAARLLHAYSDIGKELDSLCDLVSFGVAPAMLMYNMLGVVDPGDAWWHYTVMAIPVMGGLRLARFNVRDAGSTTFRGLPIPANALFWIGYAAWLWQYSCPEAYVVVLGVALISLSMVANFPMFSLKVSPTDPNKVKILRYLTLGAAIALVVIFGLSGLMWAILLYLVVSILVMR